VNILAVETSTELCSAAILRGDELMVEEAVSQNRHSELLMPMIEKLLSRSRLAIGDLDGLAFGQGPGAFTGIRIACGVVQGMAFGAHKRVAAISSFLALAEQANDSRVLVALDARMNETYLAAYARDGPDWKEVIAPGVFAQGNLPPLPARGWTAIGSGFESLPWLHGAWLGQIDRTISGARPRAGDIARLGARAFARGLAVTPERAAPLYLRDKVALTIEERKARA
jgi:tRNA threonylcarbamoyladenosine biosynthesis protein TsaB